MTARLESNAPPDHPRGLVPVVRSFEEVVVGDIRPAILSLFGAVALVLFIAAANVANLLLLRGEVRSREIAMRAVLGAARGRIVSLLFAETLLLTTAAGAVAFVASWWSLEFILTVIPQGLPKVDAIRMDGRVLAFTMGVALLTAMAACVVPGRASVGTRSPGATAQPVSRTQRCARTPRACGGTGGTCRDDRRRRGPCRAQSAETPGDRLGAHAGSPRVSRPRTESKIQRPDVSLAFSGRLRRAARVDAGHRGRNATQRAAVLWPRRVGRAEVHCRGPERRRGGCESFTQPRIDSPQLLRNVRDSHPARSTVHGCGSSRRAERRDCQRGRGRAYVARRGSGWKAPEDGRSRFNRSLVHRGGCGRANPLPGVGDAAGDPLRSREAVLEYRADACGARYSVARPDRVGGTGACRRSRSRGAGDSRRAIHRSSSTCHSHGHGSMPGLSGPSLSRRCSWRPSDSTRSWAPTFVSETGRSEFELRWVRPLPTCAISCSSKPCASRVLAQPLVSSAHVVTTRLMRGMLFQVDPLDLPTLAGAALLLIAASLLAAYVPSRRAIRLDPAALVRSQ